jgi:hypothetical protein
MAMPLCRTSDDLHPKQYGPPVWNGTIDAQWQKAHQRQPPQRHDSARIDYYDRLDIKRHARRLREFTVPELYVALGREYSCSALENECSHWKNLQDITTDPMADHRRYRYLTLEDAGQNPLPL